MIPFIPLQFDSFKTNLTMEQAISILGRSLPIKSDRRDFGEVSSFTYQPHRAIKHQSMGAVTVHVKYFSDSTGVRIKMTVFPTVITMLFLTFYIGFILLFAYLSPDFSTKALFILVWLFFYLFNCWETVETKRVIRSMFYDSIIK